jgi:RNA polymerase sigma-70 factor (ECF subfamily)
MIAGTQSSVAALERNEAFWQAAYEAHASVVMAFLVRRLGRRDEAEDLLQETFVRAIRVDSFVGGNLRGYLLSIARNLLINRIRRPRLVVPVAPAEDEQPFEHVPAGGTSPEEETAWRNFAERLDGALAKLKADHRRAFEMAVIQQHSYGEIARTTGWSLPRVKSNVHRARRSLIAQLGDFLPGTGGVTP